VFFFWWEEVFIERRKTLRARCNAAFLLFAIHPEAYSCGSRFYAVAASLGMKNGLTTGARDRVWAIVCVYVLFFVFFCCFGFCCEHRCAAGKVVGGVRVRER